MTRRAGWFAAWAALALLLEALPARGSDSPEEWLDQMSVAMDQMSYQGTFVYIQGKSIETVRVTHVADENGTRQRLVSLSGDPRELISDESGVSWILGHDNSVLQDPAFKRSFFPSVPLDRLRGVYRLEWGGKGRVAGHPVRNLRVIPDDEFRYGYSLWLDERSRLLLQWELLDINQVPMARLLFTDFRYGTEVDAGELKTSKPLGHYNTVASALPQGNTVTGQVSRWQARDLPEGFELTDHRYAQGEDDRLYEHLVYGDGLAAVSVYIESSDGEGVPGVSNMGTTHAFTRRERLVKITVIGDVPAATVLKIGRGVSPTGD